MERPITAAHLRRTRDRHAADRDRRLDHGRLDDVGGRFQGPEPPARQNQRAEGHDDGEQAQFDEQGTSSHGAGSYSLDRGD